MARSLLDDAFAHHTWATVRLIDACAALTPEQLATAAPATYGSIIDTLRHIVGSDAFDLGVAQGIVSPHVDADGLDLAEVRAMMQANGAAWSELVRTNPAPDTMIREVDPNDGFQRDAPMGIRLAQALHHADDHRSQVRSALTLLGIKPPPTSVFEFGLESGRSSEDYPS